MTAKQGATPLYFLPNAKKHDNTSRGYLPMANVTKLNIPQVLQEAQRVLAGLPDTSPLTQSDRQGCLAMFTTALEAVQHSFINDVQRTLSVRKTCTYKVVNDNTGITATYSVSFSQSTVLETSVSFQLFGDDNIIVDVLSSVAEIEELKHESREGNRVIAYGVQDLKTGTLAKLEGASKAPLTNLLAKLKAIPLYTATLTNGTSFFSLNISSPQSQNVFKGRPTFTHDAVWQEVKDEVLALQREHLAELANTTKNTTPIVDIKQLKKELTNLSQQLNNILTTLGDD